jgi:hypothetical protein
MSGSLLIGLAQRASWIVLHSSGTQVARREFFFRAELSTRRKQLLAHLPQFAELERSICALELDLLC